MFDTSYQQEPSMSSRPLGAPDQDADSIARARDAQTRERAYAIASLLAGFDDVNLHDTLPFVRVHYVAAAYAAMRMAKKSPAL